MSVHCWAQRRSEGRWGRGTRILTWWCSRPKWPPKRSTEYLQEFCLFDKNMARHLRRTISMCYPKVSDLKVPTKQFYYIAWNLPNHQFGQVCFPFRAFTMLQSQTSRHGWNLRTPPAVHKTVGLGDSLYIAGHQPQRNIEWVPWDSRGVMEIKGK